MTIDDLALIDRFKRGDESALDTLIQRNRERAYKYAFRLTRDPDQACDVVAEAFVRVYKGLGGFQGTSAFTTWLHRIITNCFLDLRKGAATRSTFSLDQMVWTEDGEVERELIGTWLAPDFEAERGERAAVLSRAISKLPECHRALIVMFHAEMLSYDEIANVLSIPVGTVKSRLNRARISLSGLLAADRELLVAV